MPLCGLGTWNLQGKECMDVTAAALSAGCRLVYAAHMYSNEKESGVRQDEIFIKNLQSRHDERKMLQCHKAIA